MGKISLGKHLNRYGTFVLKGEWGTGLYLIKGMTDREESDNVV